MDHEHLRFYWTVASGGSHKALRKAYASDDYPDPDNLMVSFTTKENAPWPGPSWFIDSGGFSALRKTGRYERTPQEFVDYLAHHQDREGVTIDWVALRDWMCEDSILDEYGRTARCHQNWTIRDHIQCRELMDEQGIRAAPVSVLQGSDPDDYLRHFDYLRDHGLTTDHIGVGTMCKRRGREEIREIAAKIRDHIPSRHTLHLFGVTQKALDIPEVVHAADSIDTAAWDRYSYYPATGRDIQGNPLDSMSHVDLNDDGQIRNTWTNMRESYNIYRQDVLGKLESVDLAPERGFQGGIGQFGPDGYDPDTAPSALRQCVCGGVVDRDEPGTHGPHTGEGCRHCENSRLTLGMARDGLLCDPDLGEHHPDCPHPTRCDAGDDHGDRCPHGQPIGQEQPA